MGFTSRWVFIHILPCKVCSRHRFHLSIMQISTTPTTDLLTFQFQVFISCIEPTQRMMSWKR